ncbi:hypothetical protein M9458_033007, partial [Cirrhinus mrigala]
KTRPLKQGRMSTETFAAPNLLTELVNALKAAFQPTPAPPSASGSPMARPTTFAGEAVECSGFLLQINLFIQMQPQMFPSENAKIVFLISLLTGKALQWAKAIWNSENPIIHSYERFTNHFSEVFSTTTGTLCTSFQLFRLQQGTSSVNEYTLYFRTLAVASGWNDTVGALLGAYRQGLNPDVRAAMALYDDSIGLESFLQRTTQVSQRLAACQPPVTAPQLASVAASSPVPEPMQIDSTRLSRTERNRRITNGLCLYCGRPGHLLRTCPIRPPRPVVSTLSTEVETTSLTLFPVTSHISNLSICVSALVTSSAGVNIVETTASSTYLIHLPFQFTFHLHEWKVLNHPSPQRSQLSTWHSRMFSASKQPPTYHRIGHEIVPWSCYLGPSSPRGEYILCPSRYARRWRRFIKPSTSPAASSFFFVGKKDGGLRPCIDYRQLNSLIKQQPYPLPLVPAAFEELRGAQVFTKLDLWSAYNLKTTFVTPTGHYEYRVMPYGLSISPSVFQTFMNEVFREFLHRFLVVYIDDILIYSQNLAEHRQHVRQVLHKLRDHSLYLKLEKCEFHRPSAQFLGYIITTEGMQMDQGKVSAIQEWPQPLTVKELQRFLGFSNFYRRFIKNYSSVTAPLTSLLRGKPKALIWNPAAHEAFQRLKEIFSTALSLHHPNPELPFTVEVDTSTTGVGAVLSQAVGEPPLLHPCPFYSRKLSPAEQNYDVGNRELL